MKQRYLNLVIILLLVAVALYIDLPNNAIKIAGRTMEPVLGLDLQGGLQVILGTKTDIPLEKLEDAKTILEQRTNALGVAENRFQVSGDRNIVAEFPGADDPEAIIANIRQTGMLEFVDLCDYDPSILPEGTVIATDFSLPEDQKVTACPADPYNGTFHTVMTGEMLTSANVGRLELGAYVIEFKLNSQGAEIFREYTTNNRGKFLGIVMDKRIISAPRVNEPIPNGEGIIEGNFTYETSNALAVNLRYGSLPVELEVEQVRQVHASLGEDSLNKSLIAGAIGFAIVMLFMGIFYRLPGVVADLAMVIFAIIALALFIMVPVTLTLPGIAGFLLSVGAALDANILIFERMKEELRRGRTVRQAIDLGWRRAWPSIRDSNIAALITAAILYWFGSTFSASIVQGFAFTLALGVVVSLFTAIVVTRTLLNVALDLIRDPDSRLHWFGI